MLRWISLAVVVVALVAVATFMSLDTTISEPRALEPPPPPVSSGPAPKVEFSEPLVFEFGTLPQQSQGTHTWQIKNVGEADLELSLSKTTCSCTVAKLKSAGAEDKPSLVVKPSASTSIELEWQTKQFRDEYSQGVTLATNDPALPTVSINVHGRVFPPVTVVPKDMVNFGSFSNEESNFSRVAVFSKDRPETMVVKVLTTRPEFFVCKTDRLSAEECTRLNVKAGSLVTIEIKPGMPLGQFHDELSIETDHPKKPDIRLSLLGSASGPITVIPERVRMPRVSSSQGATLELNLLVRGGKPTQFEVVSHPEKLDAKITPDDVATQKGRYKLTVTVRPGTSAGPVDGEIVIKTDHPAAHELRIPVKVLISNSGAD